MKCPESGVKLVEAPLARKDTLKVFCVFLKNPPGELEQILKVVCDMFAAFLSVGEGSVCAGCVKPRHPRRPVSESGGIAMIRSSSPGITRIYMIGSPWVPCSSPL